MSFPKQTLYSVKKPASVIEIIRPGASSGETLITTYEIGQARSSDDGLRGRITFSAETCKHGVRYFLLIGLRLVYTGWAMTLEQAELLAEHKLQDESYFKGVSPNTPQFELSSFGETLEAVAI